MGGKSTLHSAVLKDDTQSVSSSFDLHSWQGLTHVLKTAKEYLTDPTEYASFRNLVLQYAQQGGDVEVKKHIDAIIATFKKEESVQVPEAPIVHEEQEVAQEVHEVQEEGLSDVTEEKQETFVRGGRRTRPVFGTPQEPSTREVDDVVPPEPVPPVIEQQSVRAVPITKIIEEKSEPSIPPSEVVVPVEAEPLPDVPKTLEEYKARITEIKRAVHDRIGNPVSLMGSKDGNGKKYMSALLVALKATGAGSTGNAASAMHDLEEVFSVLMEDVELPSEERVPEGVNSDIEDVVMSAPVQDAHRAPLIEEVAEESIVVPIPEVIPEEDIDQGLDEQVILEPIAEVNIDKDVPNEVSQSVEIPIEETVSTEVVPEDINEEISQAPHNDIPPIRNESFHDSFQKTDEAISAVVGSIHKTNPLTDSDPLASVLVGEADGYDKWSHNSGKEAQEEISKILQTENAHENNESSDTVEKSHEQQSELSSPRITTALNKLLQEWSVFSGSGLFGMGPDGLEHPLYMELAPLSMGEVVAGRWEKSDPKTLRSIKEYIDAWRHEQGVTYMMNETFEHYLRRVVQRIQKRQMR